MTLPKILLSMCGLLFLTTFASATTISVSNTGGTLTTPGLGLQLAGGSLQMVTGLGAPYDGNVSGDTTSFSFSIGAPTSGSTAGTSASWTTGGGTFAFNDSTTGLVFTGTFTCSVSSPCTWTMAANFPFTGEFSASFNGSLNGKPIVGGTAQFNLLGSNNGLTVATVVPEAGTLGMVGMGLLGMAGFVKFKLSSSIKKTANRG